MLEVITNKHKKLNQFKVYRSKWHNALSIASCGRLSYLMCILVHLLNRLCQNVIRFLALVQGGMNIISYLYWFMRCKDLNGWFVYVISSWNMYLMAFWIDADDANDERIQNQLSEKKVPYFNNIKFCSIMLR